MTSEAMMTSDPSAQTPPNPKATRRNEWPLYVWAVVYTAGTVIIAIISWRQLVADTGYVNVWLGVMGFWAAASLTMFSWLGARTARGPFPRQDLRRFWLIALLNVVLMVVTSDALPTTMLHAYQYTGHNSTSLQTVSAIVSATFTVFYVLCTVALVWQGQAARASQDRAVKENVEMQQWLAKEQAKTNASLAASLATLTTLLEEQRKAPPPALIPPPATSIVTPGGTAPTGAVPHRPRRLQRALRELTI
jgi:hypothetical protein